MAQPVRPKKSLGQNFLQDPNTIRKIVASLMAGPEDCVVEIGPGMGALTAELHRAYRRFTAIEVDQRAVAYLQESIPGVDVRRLDVLDADWCALAQGCGGPVHVIGNLPYYLTSQILFSLFDASNCLAEAVVMMQLEVAERLVARPGTKAYGILSVNARLFSDPEILFKVSPNVFYPKPDVTSAVVRLGFSPISRLPEGLEPEHLRQAVRAAFGQRRKTLRNSLSRLAIDTGIEVPERWAGCRAEELTPDEFIKLAGHFRGLTSF